MLVEVPRPRREELVSRDARESLAYRGIATAGPRDDDLCEDMSEVGDSVHARFPFIGAMRSKEMMSRGGHGLDEAPMDG
jgi:hypothetical protein